MSDVPASSDALTNAELSLNVDRPSEPELPGHNGLAALSASKWGPDANSQFDVRDEIAQTYLAAVREETRRDADWHLEPDELKV